MQPSSSSKGEAGFSMVELLVIMVIISVLAAIAIPMFLNQRRNGYESALKSDLKNAATALESWAADRNDGFAPNGADTPDAALADPKQFAKSTDVTVTTVSSSSSDYCLKATHASLSDAWYYTKVKQGGELAGVPTKRACT